MCGNHIANRNHRKSDKGTMRYFKQKKKQQKNFKGGEKHNRNTKGAKELEAVIRKMV